MLFGQNIGHMIDMRVQRGQHQRNPLVRQAFKGSAALTHNSIQQLDAVQMSKKL